MMAPYRLAGASLLAAGGKIFHMGRKLYIALEAAVTAAWTAPDLPGPPDSQLEVRNVAADGLF